MLLRFFRVRKAMEGKWIFARDKPGRPVACDFVGGPLNEHKHLVAKLDQADQMHEQPGVPGQNSGETDPAEVDDRGMPADRGHAAPVLVMKRRRSATVKALLNQLSHVTSFLHGNRR